MTTEQKNEIFSILSDHDGETVARLLTDYHGMQLLDDGFAQFLVDEGIDVPFLNDEDEEDDDEEDDQND